MAVAADILGHQDIAGIEAADAAVGGFVFGGAGEGDDILAAGGLVEVLEVGRLAAGQGDGAGADPVDEGLELIHGQILEVGLAVGAGIDADNLHKGLPPALLGLRIAQKWGECRAGLDKAGIIPKYRRLLGRDKPGF